MTTKTSPVPSLRSFRVQNPPVSSKRCNQSLDLSSDKKTTKILFGAAFLEKTLQQPTPSPNQRGLPGLRIFTRDQINSGIKPSMPYSMNNAYGSQRSSIYEGNRESPGRNIVYNGDYRSARSVSRKKNEKKKPYTGGDIVERSKELLDSVRTPKEIFSEAMEQNWTKFDDINAPKYGKEKLRQMAKRLDIIVNLDEDSEFYRKCKFMRNIPAEYYHKLKALKNKKQDQDKLYEEEQQDNGERKKTPPVFRLNLEEDSLTTGLITQIKTTNPVFSSRIGSPPKKYSRQQSRRGSRPTGSEIANREKNLFFSNLANYVDVKKAMLLGNKSPLRRAKALVEGEVDWSPSQKSEKKKDYMKIWLDKTSEITRGITQHISHDDSKDLVKICRENVDDYVKQIEMKTGKLNKETGLSDGKPDSDDEKEMLEGVKDRNSKVQTVLKGNPVRRRSVSEKNTKMSSQQFYRQLLFKEQKAVDTSLLNALQPKPKPAVNKKIGRDVFTDS